MKVCRVGPKPEHLRDIQLVFDFNYLKFLILGMLYNFRIANPKFPVSIENHFWDCVSIMYFESSYQVSKEISIFKMSEITFFTSL